ncbi:MAG: GNAT family N-acetyltransferase, partial [Lachnospiraceae bacterium]|nr:GNAT family N-acetyltransferase [Lachnospiraceae bacterium]
IEEGGKIKALLDVYPIDLKLNGSEMVIKAAYIGTVAVHPKERGKGYLTKLMERAEHDAKEKGFDLMLLDGDRHRYRSYGFEKAGGKYNFDVHLGNIWHCCRELYTKEELHVPKYSFEELDEKSACIPFLFALYQRRNVTARTKENFFFCLKSNLATTYAVLADGQVVGYINLSGDEKNIHEFELEENAFIPRMLCDFMEGMGLNEIGISVGMDETEKLEQLQGASDYYNLSMSHQMKILKSDKVLEFLVAWKEKYDTRVINVEEIKKFWREAKADDREKIGLLTTSRCFMEMQKGEKSVLSGIPSDWLPLPFFLPDGDAF